jgi:hypothetical protein
MKISKAIFGVDDSYFLEFWPIQSKICKELLGIQPVLFYICDEESDFYDDGHGLVKKVYNRASGNLVHTGLLACIVRMYGTKFFPDEVCLTCDLDMLMINKDYFIKQVEKFEEDSLVIYSSDAYDLNRPEVDELFKSEPFPFRQEMYNYPYNAAKGKIFNKILDTDCSFEDFVNRHGTYKEGYKFMWMIDEFYFSDCVNNKSHGVEIYKLKRGYTSPWIADKRIDRHNFPVELEFEGEKENQKKFGVYDEEKLRQGYYIDVNCCRPYSKYKSEIDNLVNLVLKPNEVQKIKLNERTELCEIMDKWGSDKASKPSFVNYLGHNYSRYYHQIFKEFIGKNINLFELGLGSNNVSIPYNMGINGHPGAAHRAWKQYFINGEIFGADIDKSVLFQEDRIKTFYCNQKDTQSIRILWDSLKQKSFDIIIDDAIHEFEFNLLFFENSIHMLKDGGFFIIEDVTENDLKKWENILPKLKKQYSSLDIKIVRLEWTHNDNNLIVFKKFTVDSNKSLNDLGKKYNTDKITYHRFDRVYEKFLKPIKNEHIKFFEIGCGSDYASFNMWKEYFPNGQIFCMDINEKLTTERGVVYTGDQSNINDLQNISNIVGKCDVIIDDGSHVPRHQIDTFNFLFENMLLNGGIYIIEDVECSYWNPNNYIYGYKIENINVIDYFSSLPHKINSEFSGLKNNQLISSITYYRNCIIITKMNDQEIEENKREYRFKQML